MQTNLSSIHQSLKKLSLADAEEVSQCIVYGRWAELLDEVILIMTSLCSNGKALPVITLRCHHRCQRCESQAPAGTAVAEMLSMPILWVVAAKCCNTWNSNMKCAEVRIDLKEATGCRIFIRGKVRMRSVIVRMFCWTCCKDIGDKFQQDEERHMPQHALTLVSISKFPSVFD